MHVHIACTKKPGPSLPPPLPPPLHPSIHVSGWPCFHFPASDSRTPSIIIFFSIIHHHPCPFPCLTCGQCRSRSTPAPAPVALCMYAGMRVRRYVHIQYIPIIIIIQYRTVLHCRIHSRMQNAECIPTKASLPPPLIPIPIPIPAPLGSNLTSPSFAARSDFPVQKQAARPSPMGHGLFAFCKPRQPATAY